MATCTQCGFDVTGKKFCPECGTPVQAQPPVEPATASCPTCGGSVKASAAFCMHCGKSLGAQAMASASAPVTVVSQPAPHFCPACHQEVPASSAFCTNCGQSTQVAAPVTAPHSQTFCNNCGAANTPGVRFCNSCGQAMTAATGGAAYPQTGTYQQPPQYQQQPSQYMPQPQYPPQQQYPQQPQYNPGYAQPQYPPQAPMLGQQPMVLRCPVCMAMAPMGTPACPSCRTSLAGVVPTSSMAPAQGQQQGGLGGFLQGSGGQMAVGALGGAAAVIGGEMLMHNLEHNMDRRRDYDDYGDRDRGGGLLGELGNLGNDIGLF